MHRYVYKIHVLKYVCVCTHVNMLHFAPFLSPISHDNRFFFVEFQKRNGINTLSLPNQSLKSTK